MAGEGYELLKPASADRTSSCKARLRLVSGVVFLALVAILLTKANPYFGSEHRRPPPSGTPDSVGSVGQCAAITAPVASPPAPVNPWASLTVPEIIQIQDWLFSPERGLNLTQSQVAVPSDNHIYIIESYYPPKAAVLDYLSSPSTVDLPPRFARVVIHHGVAQVPIVKNYLVGPLPIGPHATLSPLTDIYHIDPIPYNARSFDARDWSSPEIYSNVARPLAEAFQVSLAQSVWFCRGSQITRNYLVVKLPGSQMTPLSREEGVPLASMDPSVACGSAGVVTFRDPFCTL